jgi:hypothetical protein
MQWLPPKPNLAKQEPRFDIKNPKIAESGLVSFDIQNVGDVASKGASIEFAMLPSSTTYTQAPNFVVSLPQIFEVKGTPIRVSGIIRIGGYVEPQDIRIKITYQSIHNPKKLLIQTNFFHWAGSRAPSEFGLYEALEERHVAEYFDKWTSKDK